MKYNVDLCYKLYRTITVEGDDIKTEDDAFEAAEASIDWRNDLDEFDWICDYEVYLVKE